MEAIEGLHFLASLPLAGTGRTEGGEKMQPFNRFHSRLFKCLGYSCRIAWDIVALKLARVEARRDSAVLI